MKRVNRWMSWRATASVATAVLASTLGFGGSALARQHDHSGHGQHGQAQHGSGASHAMHESMMKGMKQMHSMKMTGDPDHDFATMMRKHHEDGIGMSQAYLKGAKDAEMRQMAEKIVASQRQDNQKFDQWLGRHKARPAAGGTSGASHGMHEHMMKGMQDMQSMKMTGNADHDFATMMRMHHQHGIGMAEAYLGGARDDEMRGMAEKIMAEQRADNEKFDQWLATHGGSAMDAETPVHEGAVTEGAAYRHARKQ